MAERRMFSKTIIDSDAFLEMPLSTQSLYFHLSMRADDDGFLNNSKRIERLIGASEDDLKILIAKNFIIPFENGVMVIKHWRMHNYLRNDRYKPTVYQEEKEMLSVKDNGSYTLGIPDVYQMDTIGIPLVDTGKDSIGKDRLGKDSKGKDIETHFFEDADLDAKFKEFIDFRKKIKKPLKTERGIQTNINKLLELATTSEGLNVRLAIDIINQTLDNEWQSFYAIKGDKNGGRQKDSYVDEWSALYEKARMMDEQDGHC